MLNLKHKRNGRLTILKLALIALTGAQACGDAWAQSSPGRPVPVSVQPAYLKPADLETAFWNCEYAATTHRDANFEFCSAVYDALKQRKFDGDLARLLDWWQQNKQTAFRLLAESEMPQDAVTTPLVAHRSGNGALKQE